MTKLSQQLQRSLQLSTQEVKVAEDLFVPIKFDKGEILISDLSKNCHLYYILEGYVRVYTLMDGKEVTQWIGSPNYFITDLSTWIFNTPIKWTIEAITPVKAIYITQKNYHLLSSQVNNWLEKERFFIGHCFEQMEVRILEFLTLTAEQRYLSFFKQSGSLFNEVPHQYIASMLGMSPETLSRLRNKTL
ncbi:Crp/Fnr family transcriptional regulator [Myroides sp. M-43]|uniref:Crp/Fnr family transcriptional regulator n=1 Tax=Myroides oncorhynchi TaxID=2893756 RepID=UPI001E4B1F52|nr:Crp/Fnr family transcriptional regulator [Myroides oncorhynchi]MCC9042983.1 Crp/Fnr family transcriptional regulator [Myroides oncorhynchi]